MLTIMKISFYLIETTAVLQLYSAVCFGCMYSTSLVVFFFVEGEMQDFDCTSL